jgi:hypothetical protein
VWPHSCTFRAAEFRKTVTWRFWSRGLPSNCSCTLAFKMGRKCSEKRSCVKYRCRISSTLVARWDGSSLRHREMKSSAKCGQLGNSLYKVRVLSSVFLFSPLNMGLRDTSCWCRWDNFPVMDVQTLNTSGTLHCSNYNLTPLLLMLAGFVMYHPVPIIYFLSWHQIFHMYVISYITTNNTP